MTKEFPFTVEWLPKWKRTASEQSVLELLKGIDDPLELVAFALVDFCRNPRGTPADESATIEAAIKTGEHTGTIQGTFHEVYYYGCRDIDGSDTIEFSLPFRIDPEKRALILNWEERAMRDSDEF